MPIKKDASKWQTRICKMCGKSFEVRTCYTKRGQGIFCSTSCGTRYRNITDNPSWKPEVRAKISKNHADVSGVNGPMYGRKGPDAPGWIDGRNSYSGDLWRRIAFANMSNRNCEICGDEIKESRRMHIHHIDKDRNNNDLNNLMLVCVKCHNTVMHPRKRDECGKFISEKVGDNNGGK